MAATTPPRSELVRFSPAEIRLHWATAALMGVLVVTAAFLYVDPLSSMFGRRQLLSTTHLWAGLLLPLPVMLAALLSPAFRHDASRLNRFQDEDRAWLRRARRGDRRGPAGKFNAGQKLMAAGVFGSGLVLFLTGLMMHFAERFPVDLRTGATFVHDVTAALLVVLLAGHIWMATKDPHALAGMANGRVPADWAEREHPLWDGD